MERSLLVVHADVRANTNTICTSHDLDHVAYDGDGRDGDHGDDDHDASHVCRWYACDDDA